MTCHELRSYIRDPERLATGTETNSAEIVAHTAICDGCGRLLEEQRELMTSLSFVRESAPQIRPSLDTAVLAYYRKYAVEKANSVRVTPSRRRISLIAAFAWTAAVAVAGFIANEELRLLVPTEEAASRTTQSVGSQVRTAPKSTSPQPNAPQQLSSKSHRRTVLTKSASKSLATAERARGNTDETAASVADPLPVEFRSLMYCDALSCGGPMQMIRVQLPPSAAGLARGWAQSNQVVYADVLVGSDGIARGIRIVQ